jgi:TrmH family RNA methyltransferase
MPLRIVQSKHNPRLKQLKRALAQPLSETGAGGRVLAGIEGPNLLAEAVRAGLRIECVFVAEGNERLLAALPLDRNAEILLLPKALLDSALTTEAPQPIAALVEPFDWIWRDLLEGGVDGQTEAKPLVLVLAGLQDPGNLGTVLRSAEAFGASGVISLPGTVSAWNAKAVRASAGSVFRVPTLSAEVEECFMRLRVAGIQVWTTSVRGAQPVDFADLAGPAAVLIGNEGNGVPNELAAMADGALTIPCPGPVESLNAAVAASVLLYEAARQRSVGSIASHPSDKNKNVARMGHPDQVGHPDSISGRVR